MLRYGKMPLLLLCAITSVAIAAAATLSHQDGRQPEQTGPAGKGKGRLADLPAVELESAETADAEKDAKRVAKSKKYNDPRGIKIDPAHPLTRGSLRNDWEFGLASTLPIEQSRAVVVGEVVKARAYLSEDRTNVYSEYTVRVEAVLKNDPHSPISAGDSVALERQGGRVRFPSGHEEAFYVAGQAPPLAGRRYVFFIGHNPRDAQNRNADAPETSWHILTGYELRAGRVVALDDAGGANFKEHSGKDEADFLGEVRRLIAPSR